MRVINFKNRFSNGFNMETQGAEARANRMVLEEGTITEFTFATIIESKTGEQSSLQYPESMVYKF